MYGVESGPGNSQMTQVALTISSEYGWDGVYPSGPEGGFWGHVANPAPRSYVTDFSSATGVVGDSNYEYNSCRAQYKWNNVPVALQGATHFRKCGFATTDRDLFINGWDLYSKSTRIQFEIDMAPGEHVMLFVIISEEWHGGWTSTDMEGLGFEKISAAEITVDNWLDAPLSYDIYQKTLTEASSRCFDCPTGTYGMMQGVEFCTPCEAGKYSTTTAATAESTCVGCPSYTHSGLGSGNCSCIMGYTGPDGVECTACAPGSFKDVNGSAACSPCARGKYSTSTAATAESTCVGCPSYTHSPDGSGMLANCTCVKGYTGSDGNSCMACDAGKHKSTNGSAPCTWCPPGKFSSSSATWCNDCPPNTNSRLGSNVVTNCTCNAGYTGPDGAACQACVAGTYKDINGSALCMRCISGKFSNATGETTGKTCKDCPANTHSEVGSGMMIHCTCNSGYTGPDGVACVACAGGTYKDGNGSAVCTLCPAGKFSTATAATSKSTCNDCPPGTYSINVIRIGAQFCTQCPPGKYSGSKAATSMSTCKACGMDTYSASNRSLCLICPLNSIAPASSIELQDCRCNAGYTGPDGGLCEACIPPTFKETNGSHACTAPEYEFFDCGIRCAIGMASTGPNPQNCNVRSACARTHTLTLQTIHT